MSGRRFELLTTNEVYHAFNRSIGSENIFKDKRILQRALDLIDYYRFPQRLRFSFFKRLPDQMKQRYYCGYHELEPFVTIYAFALMPNHFHVLLRQLTDNGIKNFISNFQNSVGKYYNILTHRTGSIFQKPFKAKRVENNEIFLHIGRYIHLNPVTSFIVTIDELATYPWTSYPLFIGSQIIDLIDAKFTLNNFSSVLQYKRFIENQADYQKTLHDIKGLLFDY